MIFQYINRLLAFSFLAVISNALSAQQVHFVYLQTENSQPFYIKLNNAVTSSSSLGYLIIPKLPDGDYKITVGFPKKEFPEEKFQLLVDKKNEGFLLKNFDDRGWGLFNLQSFSVTMGAGQFDSTNVATNVQSDPFSIMLATVVKDSSILERPAEVVKTTPVNRDTVVTANGERDTAGMISQTDQPVVLSTITRTLFNKNQDGVEMIYIDKLENTIDTIRIFIPGSVSGKIAESSSNNGDAAERKTDTVAHEILKSTEPPITGSENDLAVAEKSNDLNNGDKKDITPSTQNFPMLQKNANDQGTPEVANTNDKKEDKVIKEETRQENGFPKVVEYSKINSDCKAFASNEDFIKLRKKIAGENNDDDMLKEAKKGFRSRCYSTEQIKNLSFLFLTDEGKYRFFDAAYAFTSDSNQYYKLQGQLSDPYYINRFKAMISK